LDDVSVLRVTTCNPSGFSNLVVTSQAAFEACESVVIGSSFQDESGADVSVRSGLDIEFLP